MSSDYIPIDSSDSHKKDGRAALTRLQLLLKIFAFLCIILIASFLATVAIQRQFISHEVPVTHENPIAVKSLPVDSTFSTFRPPIGGQLSCSRRVMVKSTSSPTDANQVRPADIQYIAAMGDSYTTGYLSFTSESDTTVDEMRNAVGNSFAMGGNDEMASHVTLANILRHLNPTLRGYSIGIGLNEQVTNLNVAVPGMWVDDMQRQARELIRRFNKYSVQSIQNDWKLIQIFAGTRDVSGFCMGQGGTNKQEYKRNMTEAIGILQQALPKTIISIIGTGNFDFLWNAVKNSDRSNEANIGFKMSGPCQIADAEILSQRRIEEYREANTEIVLEMQTRTRRDHAVIVQHIFDDLWMPLRNADGAFNAEFFAADVFHFSNYGNSLIAKQLWNQLVSPDSKKITNNARMADEKEALLCPELRCPFIRTPSNSVKCVMSEENIIDGVL
ncbi:hypothetical protein PRIPAC_74065 [Pristionchus pacificus]|nr:hypothetical protein PRIPAC_74065 [Pristionchus pacificus]